ncbi:hypothetical protein VARIO8X_160075 [Burkholderiales bacterium 8X]|nr:hypothetical protein VARIO8X_160075 [Burkholderiales bacterium 8X]
MRMNDSTGRDSVKQYSAYLVFTLSRRPGPRDLQ